MRDLGQWDPEQRLGVRREGRTGSGPLSSLEAAEEGPIAAAATAAAFVKLGTRSLEPSAAITSACHPLITINFLKFLSTLFNQLVHFP